MGRHFPEDTVGRHFPEDTVGRHFPEDTVGRHFPEDTVGRHFPEDTVGRYFVLLLLSFLLYCPDGIFSVGNWGCLSWGKPAATESRYPTSEKRQSGVISEE